MAKGNPLKNLLNEVMEEVIARQISDAQLSAYAALKALVTDDEVFEAFFDATQRMVWESGHTPVNNRDTMRNMLKEHLALLKVFYQDDIEKRKEEYGL